MSTNKVLFALMLAVICGCSEASTQESPELKVLKDLKLPAFQLEHESSGVLWRQTINQNGSVPAQQRIAFNDGSQACLTFNNESKLTSFSLERNHTRVAEGTYDESGRRLVNRKNYRADGSLESTWQSKDGCDHWRYFNSEGQLEREVVVLADGGERITTFDSGMPERIQVNLPKEFAHSLKTSTGLTVTYNMVGRRLVNWQVTNADGQLDHSGRILPSGDIEFSVYAGGVLKRKQVWMMIGEDWQRPYYRLAQMEGYWEDGKTVHFKIDLHGAGTLKNILTYYKTGTLDTARQFDIEGRHIQIDQFEESGKQKSTFNYGTVNRPRGFTPDGLRDVPAGDLYDFGKEPFSTPEVAGATHPLFRSK